MKDGRTHLAYKAEHAVDLESGALLAVTLQSVSIARSISVSSSTVNMTGFCILSSAPIVAPRSQRFATPAERDPATGRRTTSSIEAEGPLRYRFATSR
jgi:hypothetical protein